MAEVEKRFHSNTKSALAKTAHHTDLYVHRGLSDVCLANLLIFDDYIWVERIGGTLDPLRCPKQAIDAFTNLYARKLKPITATLFQPHVEKIAS